MRAAESLVLKLLPVSLLVTTTSISLALFSISKTHLYWKLLRSCRPQQSHSWHCCPGICYAFGNCASIRFVLRYQLCSTSPRVQRFCPSKLPQTPLSTFNTTSRLDSLMELLPCCGSGRCFWTNLWSNMGRDLDTFDHAYDP
jgi:hypothetical protein